MDSQHSDLLALVPKLGDLSTDQVSTVYAALVKQSIERCAQDGWYWLRFVSTRDEADREHVIKPFPIHLDYLREVWSLIDQLQCVVIAKSRQMLLTWAIVAYCTWTARYHPGVAIYWQTKAWEDAVEAVAMPSGGRHGRCQFIEENLPPWLRMPYKPSEGRIQYPNGSIIQALAGGADKIRSKVATIVVEDEFAHQEDQDGVYTAVSPLVQKGAKAVFVSSPNGSSNYFATLWHGRPVGRGAQQ